MNDEQSIAYFRVSTQKQGNSGLGLEAQREAVLRYLRGDAGRLVAEFVEVETGKGRNALARRPELRAAIALAQKTGATLLIAKLDRLARDVRFFLEALDDYGISIKFLDFPDIDPKTSQGRMVLISMANFAEFEGRRISERTKGALAAAKARGVQLGTAGAANIRPNIEQRQAAADAHAIKLAGLIEGMQARGMAQRAMVAELNALGIKTSTGKESWTLSQLQRVLARLPAAEALA
jgi:DNA invertase Pin-like site-specific DNA recombinase